MLAAAVWADTHGVCPGEGEADVEGLTAAWELPSALCRARGWQAALHRAGETWPLCAALPGSSIFLSRCFCQFSSVTG